MKRTVDAARFALSEPVVFGSPAPGLIYTDRPAAYVVVINCEGRVAVVSSKTGHFLPGGGSLSGEAPEDTVLREVREELGRSARILRRLGDAIQYFSAEEIAYKMRAVFFAADLADEQWGTGESELYWLPVAVIDGTFFHRSHEWAIHQALKPSG